MKSGRFLAIVSLLLTVVGCHKSTANVRTIAVIPQGATHEYWKSVHAGVEKAATRRCLLQLGGHIVGNLARRW